MKILPASILKIEPVTTQAFQCAGGISAFPDAYTLAIGKPSGQKANSSRIILEEFSVWLVFRPAAFLFWSAIHPKPGGTSLEGQAPFSFKLNFQETKGIKPLKNTVHPLWAVPAFQGNLLIGLLKIKGVAYPLPLKQARRPKSRHLLAKSLEGENQTQKKNKQETDQWKNR